LEGKHEGAVLAALRIYHRLGYAVQDNNAVFSILDPRSRYDEHGGAQFRNRDLPFPLQVAHDWIPLAVRSNVVSPMQRRAERIPSAALPGSLADTDHLVFASPASSGSGEATVGGDRRAKHEAVMRGKVDEPFPGRYFPHALSAPRITAGRQKPPPIGAEPEGADIPALISDEDAQDVAVIAVPEADLPHVVA
jgi:hypothetical protein